MNTRYINDSVHWYMNDLSSRVVAESGIPTDRFHLGKLILQGLKDAPDFVLQIDGATGESETNESILERTIKCATSFRALGLKTGDVIVLMAPNHLDLCIPYYAAMYLGLIIAAVDRTLTKINEIEGTFSINKPKMIFCQSEKASDVQIALNNLDLDSQIVTFDKGDYLLSFPEFLEKYGEEASVDEFKCSDFDPEDAVALLISTSGTTGLPKAAAATHKNFAISGAYWWARYTKFPTPLHRVMICSPLQWLTAIAHFLLSPIFRYTRLQTSLPLTQEHAYYLINTYKPSYTIMSPTFMQSLLRIGEREQCDFSCLDLLFLGGSFTPADLIAEIKEVAPNVEVCDAYGMSELTGLGFTSFNAPIGSCGKPLGCHEYRIVNVETQEDITEPHVQGELWIRGPAIFKGYYDNPEATEETFAEGRWFKTGDIFYRDEEYNFFFVERYKLLLKYKSAHISPVEVENVIRQHPGVFDVAVTGIPDRDVGDLPVACVVRQPDSDVTADEIKDLVKDTLEDCKQLRGGVIFVDQIPMTATTKVHRRMLKEMVLTMERE